MQHLINHLMCVFRLFKCYYLINRFTLNSPCLQIILHFKQGTRRTRPPQSTNAPWVHHLLSSFASAFVICLTSFLHQHQPFSLPSDSLYQVFNFSWFSPSSRIIASAISLSPLQPSHSLAYMYRFSGCVGNQIVLLTIAQITCMHFKHVAF